MEHKNGCTDSRMIKENMCDSCASMFDSLGGLEGRLLLCEELGHTPHCKKYQFHILSISIEQFKKEFKAAIFKPMEKFLDWLAKKLA